MTFHVIAYIKIFFLTFILFVSLLGVIVMAGFNEKTREGALTKVYIYLFIEPEGGYFSQTVQVRNKSNVVLFVPGIVKIRWIECTKKWYYKPPIFLDPRPIVTGISGCEDSREHSITYEEVEVLSRYCIRGGWFNELLVRANVTNNFGCTW